MAGRIIGCNSLHLAELTQDTKDGATYETPFAVPNVISVEIKDSSESTTFYSDDQAEQVINSFGSKEVTIVLGTLSNEIESQITGQEYKNGVFIQNANATTKEFALMLKAPMSRGGDQYVCLYKGALVRTDSAYQSKEEGISDQQITLTGTFMPLAFNGRVSIKADSTDAGNTEIIKTWFTEVPVDLDKGIGGLLEERKKNK